MPAKKVTMQDVADACGLSRNTVSKVFNGRGAVPPATQQRILQKADELGYRQTYKSASEKHIQAPCGKSIALLTQRMPENYHFGTIFLPFFTQALSRSGYTLMMYEVSADESERCVLPAHLHLPQTAGILADDGEPYHDPSWLVARLREMPVMPDAFICANDFLATPMLRDSTRRG